MTLLLFICYGRQKNKINGPLNAIINHHFENWTTPSKLISRTNTLYGPDEIELDKVQDNQTPFWWEFDF